MNPISEKSFTEIISELPTQFTPARCSPLAIIATARTPHLTSLESETCDLHRRQVVKTTSEHLGVQGLKVCANFREEQTPWVRVYPANRPTHFTIFIRERIVPHGSVTLPASRHSYNY